MPDPKGRGLVLLKLGGSLLTDKSRPNTARRSVIRRMAREVAESRKAWSGRLVVGHGSGSFGHAAAARYGLAGGRFPRDRGTGAARTQQAARELHRVVFEALLESGIRPFSIPPSGFIVARNGVVSRVFLHPLLSALDAGFVPVVFGDVVADASGGACVLSTEAVFLALARRLARRGRPVGRVFWAGDTDGVFDEDGAVIPRIDGAVWRRVRKGVSGAAGTDVTGGMALKVECALALGRLGVESRVLNGRAVRRLSDALSGRKVPGTKIEAAFDR